MRTKLTITAAEITTAVKPIAAKVNAHSKKTRTVFITVGRDVQTKLVSLTKGFKDTGKGGAAKVKKAIVKVKQAIWTEIAKQTSWSYSYVEQAHKAYLAASMRAIVDKIKPVKNCKHGKAGWQFGSTVYKHGLLVCDRQNDGSYALKKSVTETAFKAVLQRYFNGKTTIEILGKECRALAQNVAVTELPTETVKKAVEFEATETGSESTAVDGLSVETCHRYLEVVVDRLMKENDKTAVHGQNVWFAKMCKTCTAFTEATPVAK